MTSQNPPYPYFTGITYNSSFFSSTSSGLTQGQANLLYLQKTTTDTATATETFSAGLIASSVTTSTITSSGSGVDISIGNSQVAGKLNLGNGSNHAGQISIGSTSANPYISIGTAGTGGSTNIQIGSTSASSLQILNTSSTITGPLTASGGISTTTLDTSTPASNFSLIPSLGAATTMGIGVAAPTYGTVKTIQIGETTTTSVHAGGIDCTGTSINGAVAPAIGTLTIAGAQTTGTLVIGGGIRTTGGLGGSIAIGANASNVAPISIGAVGNTTTINGALTTTGLTTASGGIISNGFKYINTVTTPLVNDAGYYSAWNLSGTQGESNIVTLSQAPSGGVSFYNRITSPSIGGVTYLGGIFQTAMALIPTGIFNIASINLPYTTLPTLTSTQIGYTITYFPSTSITMSSSPSNQIISSFTLPIGVWSCSYVVRFINQSGTTSFTNLTLDMNLPTPPTGYPTTYGYNQHNVAETSIALGYANIAVSGSSIITNGVSQTLNLNLLATFTATGLAQIEGSTIPCTYMMATRIA